MEITMSTNDVNNFSVSELNYIRDAIENMNKFNQIEVLRILNNHKDISIINKIKLLDIKKFDSSTKFLIYNIIENK